MRTVLRHRFPVGGFRLPSGHHCQEADLPRGYPHRIKLSFPCASKHWRALFIELVIRMVQIWNCQGSFWWIPKKSEGPRRLPISPVHKDAFYATADRDDFCISICTTNSGFQFVCLILCKICVNQTGDVRGKDSSPTNVKTASTLKRHGYCQTAGTYMGKDYHVSACTWICSGILFPAVRAGVALHTKYLTAGRVGASFLHRPRLLSSGRCGIFVFCLWPYHTMATLEIHGKKVARTGV